MKINNKTSETNNTNMKYLFVYMQNYCLFFFIFIFSFTVESCKKFVEVDTPPTQIATATLYNSDVTAIAAIRGIYSQMLNSTGFASGGPNSITLLAALSSDEFINYLTFSQDISSFYTNSIISSNSVIKNSLWQPAYQYIYYANSVLEGLTHSNGVTAATTQQLRGEAKFIRAFCHFYLVNMFGNVPLVTSSDYRINSIASRVPTTQVYLQIIADIKDAQNLLANDYSFSNGERVEPNKWAATALLSRVYLYTGDWANAETQASALINNTASYSLVSDLNGVFLSNSTEAIWQLKPVTPGLNTNEGNTFIIAGMPQFVSLKNTLINAFETGDNRRKQWVDSIIVGTNIYYFPYKYKILSSSNLTEYSMVLRLAEQYLIRAEARAQLGESNAVDDLNVIRNRAGLPAYAGAMDQVSLLSAVYRERQIELFTEWGHRWFDLKRSGTIDSVMNLVALNKGGIWKTNQKLYPIPQSEISADKNISQNPGY